MPPCSPRPGPIPNVTSRTEEPQLHFGRKAQRRCTSRTTIAASLRAPTRRAIELSTRTRNLRNDRVPFDPALSAPASRLSVRPSRPTTPARRGRPRAPAAGGVFAAGEASAAHPGSNGGTLTERRCPCPARRRLLATGGSLLDNAVDSTTGTVLMRRRPMTTSACWGGSSSACACRRCGRRSLSTRRSSRGGRRLRLRGPGRWRRRGAGSMLPPAYRGGRHRQGAAGGRNVVVTDGPVAADARAMTQAVTTEDRPATSWQPPLRGRQRNDVGIMNLRTHHFAARY